jgi:hypothetical protein
VVVVAVVVVVVVVLAMCSHALRTTINNHHSHNRPGTRHSVLYVGALCVSTKTQPSSGSPQITCKPVHGTQYRLDLSNGSEVFREVQTESLYRMLIHCSLQRNFEGRSLLMGRQKFTTIDYIELAECDTVWGINCVCRWLSATLICCCANTKPSLHVSRYIQSFCHK